MNPEPTGEVLCAEPDGETHIESLMSACIHCKSPVVSVKLNANSEWSEWAHALTGQKACDIGPTTPPTTERGN